MITRRLWIRLLVTALLAAASLALYGLMPQYRLIGGELLDNPDFAAGLDHWQTSDDVSAADGVARMHNAEPGNIVGMVSRINDPVGAYFAFSGDVRLASVQPDAGRGRGARLVLVSTYLNGAERWALPHLVTLQTGSFNWHRYDNVFHVPPRTTSLLAYVQLYRATGSFEVRHLSVQRAEPIMAFTLASRGLLAVWIVTAPWLLWPMVQIARGDLGVALVLVVGVGIGVATQVPHSAKTGLLLASQVIEKQVSRLLHLDMEPHDGAATTTAPAASDESTYSWDGFDKIGHFIAHILLGAVAFWAFRRQPRPIVLLCLLVFAGLTEVLQNFAIDRDPLVTDALINMTGVLTGVAPVWAWLQFRRRSVA